MGGFWSKLAFSVQSFLPGRSARQKSQTANKTPNSRITRCFGCSAALAIVSFVGTEQPRVWAQISTFHEISVQLLLNIMRQREHFSEFFSPKIHPFRVEMTQGICGCWLFSQISLRLARPPTIRQPPLKNASRAYREKKCLRSLVIIFNFDDGKTY